MSDTPHPAPARDDDSVLPGLVKGGAIAGTLTWAFILVSFIAAVNTPGAGLQVLGPLLALIVATPVFFIFVLPALLFGFLGGESGAKTGAGFLLGGVAVVALVASIPMLR